MTSLARDRKVSDTKLRITIIRNESSQLLSPSYQIRLVPLVKFLRKKMHFVEEVSLRDFLRDPYFCDVIIFQRYISEDGKINSRFSLAALKVLRKNCKTLAWDLDDDLHELESRMNDSENQFSFIRESQSNADIFIVSTKALLNRPFYNERAFLVPNQPIKKMKKVRLLHTKNRIILGYLGNFDRKSELMIFFINLVSQYPNKKIHFHSYGVPLDFAVEINTLSPKIVIHDHPTMEYRSVLNHYSRLKLNFSIAPLADTVFNQSKSAIKFIDYSMNKAPILMSKVGEIAELLPDYDLLPPMGTENESIIWSNKIELILKRNRIIVREENAARTEFQISRNPISQGNHFEELLNLFLEKNFEY
jgi:hypothetical protein